MTSFIIIIQEFFMFLDDEHFHGIKFECILLSNKRSSIWRHIHDIIQFIFLFWILIIKHYYLKIY